MTTEQAVSKGTVLVAEDSRIQAKMLADRLPVRQRTN